MGNPKAFLNIPRKEAGYRPINDRIHDFGEVEQTLNTHDRQLQASRCMDCGVPFCHWACPLGNKPPEWNDAIYRSDWEKAYKLITETNDFPEFTGRVCPAPCEHACVINLMDHQPTTIRENEVAIAEYAFAENFVKPCVPVRNGMRVGVVGAGPAGLMAASRLNKLGYSVKVFESSEDSGGLLRYGIPNFKLNKSVIDRRMDVLRAEGIDFEFNCYVHPDKLPAGFDAFVWAVGTPEARDLQVPGRTLKGIYLAMEMLAQQNRVLAGWEIDKADRISAHGKKVLVIGGGDTGSDCIGTARRQGCKSVVQIEIMPRPVDGPDDPANPWPLFPRVLKTTSSHEEGCVRRWNLNTLEFIGSNGVVTGAKVQEVSWTRNAEGQFVMSPAADPEIIECDMVLLAMGFLKPELPSFPENVFPAGDCVHGASLVVRALADGRKAAQQVHRYLSNKS